MTRATEKQPRGRRGQSHSDRGDHYDQSARNSLAVGLGSGCEKERCHGRH